jgi:predicted O-methyltransferase YrrM
MENPIEYVEWYHTKFRSTYHHKAFPEMIHDHRVLISLIDAYNIQTVCEIGTWNGDTALMMYLYPRIRRVKCIDIHKDLGVKFDQPNHMLRSKEEYGIMFKNTFVELVFADTMQYVRGNEEHDLVFIDACHDYEHVKNDSELALSWNPKVLCYHDYHNGNTGVDQYIDEQKEKGTEFTHFKNSCIVSRNLRQ